MAQRAQAWQSADADNRPARGAGVRWPGDRLGAQVCTRPRYTIELSLDGREWKTVRNVTAGNGGRDSHLLPESEARWIRLTHCGCRARRRYHRDPRARPGVRRITERLRSRAGKHSKRGCYPRAYYDSNPTGLSSASTQIHKKGCSRKTARSRRARRVSRSSLSSGPAIPLLSWADVTSRTFVGGRLLPVPTVQWRHRGRRSCTITALAAGYEAVMRIRASTYRVENPTQVQRQLTLALAVRPFQVNPPAQFLNTAGGVSSDSGSRVGRWQCPGRWHRSDASANASRQHLWRCRSTRMHRATGWHRGVPQRLCTMNRALHPARCCTTLTLLLASHATSCWTCRSTRAENAP